MAGANPITSRRSSPPNSDKFDSFIAAVLHPLSPEELTDTQYNSVLRQTRKEAWRRAVANADFYKHLLHAAYRLDSTSYPVTGNNIKLPSSMDLIGRWRDALVKAILTPAEYKSDVEWKRRGMKQAIYASVPKEKLLAAIAADEAFFAAHPVAIRRKRR